MPQIKKLSFTFHYLKRSHATPTGLSIYPNVDQLQDEVLLFLSAAIVRTLTQRHGLEKSLEMVHNAGYGKIGNATAFTLQNCNQQEIDDLYLKLPENEYDDDDDDDDGDDDDDDDDV